VYEREAAEGYGGGRYQGAGKKRLFTFQTERKPQIFKDSKGKRATVPYHAGRTLHPKVLTSILKDADINIETFRKML
jgi:hypothetical protein